MAERILFGQLQLRAVCKRCHSVMDDIEPSGATEFYHPKTFNDGKANWCKNAGLSFYFDGLNFTMAKQGARSTVRNEIELFQKKSERRRNKRNAKMGR